MNGNLMLFIGICLGIIIAAGIALWIWLHMTEGNDKPLEPDDITKRIGECYNNNK